MARCGVEWTAPARDDGDDARVIRPGCHFCIPRRVGPRPPGRGRTEGGQGDKIAVRWFVRSTTFNCFSDPPVFLSRPENRAGQPGDRVTLRCNVDSNPSPSYLWHHTSAVDGKRRLVGKDDVCSSRKNHVTVKSSFRKFGESDSVGEHEDRRRVRVRGRRGRPQRGRGQGDGAHHGPAGHRQREEPGGAVRRPLPVQGAGIEHEHAVGPARRDRVRGVRGLLRPRGRHNRMVVQSEIKLFPVPTFPFIKTEIAGKNPRSARRRRRRRRRAPFYCEKVGL